MVHSDRSILFMLTFDVSQIFFASKKLLVVLVLKKRKDRLLIFSRSLWHWSISIFSTDMPITSNIWRTFYSRLCWRIDVGIPGICKHSLHCRCPALSLYFHWNTVDCFSNTNISLDSLEVSVHWFYFIFQRFYCGFNFIFLTHKDSNQLWLAEFL